MYQRNKKKFLLMALAGFFIFVSILLAEVNSVVYLALDNIFHIVDYKFLISFVLGIFSGGFLFMLLVERYYTSIIVRFFYLLTSSWMGILVYFFIENSTLY
jgi:hypothetical protein